MRNFPCYDNNGNPQLDKEDLEDIKKRVAYGRHILYLLSATNSLKDFHKKAPEFPLQDFFGFANMEIVNEKKNKLQHHNAIFQETLDSDKESKEALARWGIDFHKISENWKNLVEEEIDKTALSIRLSNRVIQEALKQTELAKQKKAEWEGQKSNIGILKRDYNRIEEEIVDIMSGAFMAKVTDRVMIDRLTAKKRKELEETQILIDEYSKLDEVSQYIEMLPEILSKTFELATSALRLRKIKEAREDILKLIEICTFELSVNTKKELKVKLFDTLDGVFILNGGRYRIRTYDPLRVKQML